MSITLAQLAGSLIASFEGCRLASYQDSGGVWTIGFGHTGTVHGIRLDVGVSITQAEANDLLAADMSFLFHQVSNRPILEAAALLSFGYNCGSGTLQRVLMGGAELTAFVHDAHGSMLPGLVARRNLEAALIATSKQLSADG